MDMIEALRRLKAAGWGGVAVWETWPKKYNGCLMKPDCTLHLDMVLWEYAPNAQAALEQLVAIGEANLYN